MVVASDFHGPSPRPSDRRREIGGKKKRERKRKGKIEKKLKNSEKLKKNCKNFTPQRLYQRFPTNDYIDKLSKKNIIKLIQLKNLELIWLLYNMFMTF